MTTGTGKMNRLNFGQQQKVWELFESATPASTSEWFIVKQSAFLDQDDPILTRYEGHKWNATIFAEFATARLGFTVKPANVLGILKTQGYKLRASPKKKEIAGDLESLQRDVADILAYLTRQDKDWREKAHADQGITG